MLWTFLGPVLLALISADVRYSLVRALLLALVKPASWHHFWDPERKTEERLKRSRGKSSSKGTDEAAPCADSHNVELQGLSNYKLLLVSEPCLGAWHSVSAHYQQIHIITAHGRHYK